MHCPEWLDEKYLTHPVLKPLYERVCKAWEEMEINKSSGGEFFESAGERFADLYEELVAAWEAAKNESDI